MHEYLVFALIWICMHEYLVFAFAGVCVCISILYLHSLRSVYA